MRKVQKLDCLAINVLWHAIMEATLVSHWMGDQTFIVSSSSVLRKAR
jgi:hypothetical protein